MYKETNSYFSKLCCLSNIYISLIVFIIIKFYLNFKNYRKGRNIIPPRRKKFFKRGGYITAPYSLENYPKFEFFVSWFWKFFWGL